MICSGGGSGGGGTGANGASRGRRSGGPDGDGVERWGGAGGDDGGRGGGGGAQGVGRSFLQTVVVTAVAIYGGKQKGQSERWNGGDGGGGGGGTIFSLSRQVDYFVYMGYQFRRKRDKSRIVKPGNRGTTKVTSVQTIKHDKARYGTARHTHDPM